MKHIRRIRPLFWLLLVWFIIILANIWRYAADNGFLAIFSFLMIVHLGIYWMMLSVKMVRSFQWYFLLAQTGLVLTITQVTQNEVIALCLSLALTAVVIDTLKQVRPILIAVAGYLLLFLLYMTTIGSQISWYFLWRGDGGSLTVLALFVPPTLLLYLLQVSLAHKRTQALLHELDAAHAQLSAYALHVEELTMNTERQRIARDLHDTLVQGVAGLIMQLDVVNTQLRQQKIARAQELMEQVIEDARDTLTDARYAIGELRTERVRPDDLVEVVQEEINRFTAATDISCIADIDLLSTTPSPFCVHVLRAITEGLANVARHAQARTVWVQATHHDGILTIEVRDDGTGFDPQTVNTQVGHYGLLGVRERARLAEGQLEILSARGAGTTLRLRIPALEREEVVCPDAFVS